jgi:hypothetical protein
MLSSRPMMGKARHVLCSDVFLAIRMTRSQYVVSFTISEAKRYSTRSGRTPNAMKHCFMYSPQMAIFSISPPNLLFIHECQSARKTVNLKPACIKSLILDPQTKPIPMCIILGELRLTYSSLSRTLETPIGSRLCVCLKQCADFLGGYDLLCVSGNKVHSLF